MNENYRFATYKARIIMYGIDYSGVTFDAARQVKYKKRKVRAEVSGFRVFDGERCGEVIPSEIVICWRSLRSLVKTRDNPESPVKMYAESSKYVLRFEPENDVLSAELVPGCPSLSALITIGGTAYTAGDFVSIVGMDRVSILLFDGCWNWNERKPCRFCDMHPKPEGAVTAIPSLNELPDTDFDVRKWRNAREGVLLEGVKKSLHILREQGHVAPHFHLVIMSGNLDDGAALWDMLSNLCSAIREYIPEDVIVNVQPHPDRASLERLKDIGVATLQYNIEVFGERLFENTCPGKLPYSVFMRKLDEAVSVFGPGHVRSNIVLGLQDIREAQEGARMLADMGIVTDYSIFQPKRGTALENRKPPPLDDVLNFSLFLRDLYAEYGFKPVFCNMSSRSSVMNELCGNVS